MEINNNINTVLYNNLKKMMELSKNVQVKNF